MVESNAFLPALISEEILKHQHIVTDMASGQVFVYRDGYYDYKNSIPYLKQEIQRILCAGSTTNKVNEVLNYIIRATYTEVKTDPNYLCLNNCLLNLNTMQTEPFTPNKIVTFKIPVTYRPEVNSKPFTNFGHELVDEKGLITLQQACGNILAPHYLNKKLIYLYGDNDSGKSTFLKIIQLFLSPDNYASLSLNQLNEKFTNARIYCKLANITADENYRLQIKSYSIIKSLTGGDTLTLQFKGKDAFDMESNAKLFFSGNGIPEINEKEVDDAFYRRWQFVKFPNHFEPNDTIVPLYTTDVMKSSILNWMIEGYQKLKSNGWNYIYETTIPEARKLFESAKYTHTLLEQWLKECCVAWNGYTPKKTLWKHYGEWCRNKERMDFDDYTPFVKAMLRQMTITVSEHEHERVDCFKGIQIL